ncbi:Monooxygenase ptaG [Lachnellula suecica]|uniref:Monooxygenase ptaG n=1 Tax=Lachnellula suecica TaxID=602035 RepID=A0A8T9CJB9_9HELO|nr:Monooxygenase ptaG [Lachnellula suecica]
MSAPANIQAATIDKYVAGWKKMSPQEMLATWSGNATQQGLPFTMSQPPKTRAQVEASLPKLSEILLNFKVTVTIYHGYIRHFNLTHPKLTIHNVVHDPSKGKAVIYAVSQADTPFGVPWRNEYASFLTFDESGEKIVKLEEMVDSAFVKAFLPPFQKYMSEQASQSG